MFASPSIGRGAAEPARRHQHPRPLVISDDGDLVDDLLRLAAAAGVEVEVAGELFAARRSWPSAPVVLIAADAVRPLAAAGLRRRPGVVVIGAAGEDAGIWERAVTVGAEEVFVLPDDDTRVVDRFSDSVEPQGAGGRTVGILGGRGGSGASTLAAGLAISACRRRLRAVLIDGDPLGGGIDMLVGGEDTGGLRWPDLAGTQGKVASDTLTQALPRIDELLVLSWDRGDLLSITSEAMHTVLSAAQRGSDLVVVDLPRRLDAAAEVALSSVDLALLLVPAEIRGAAAAARVAAAAGLLTSDLRVVVRGPAPSGLSADVIADALGLPLAGELKAEPGLAVAAERGEPPARRSGGPLANFCDGLLADLFATSPAAA